MVGAKVLLGVLLWLHPSSATKLNSVRLGGLFSPFNADGSRNEMGAQGLAGFLLAVSEINEDTTLLPNHRIEVVVADPLDESIASNIDAANYLTVTCFNRSGADVVVGGVSDMQTMNTNVVFNQHKTVQITAVASSALLSVGVDYPYKLRVTPSDSHVGMANQFLVLYRMGLRRILPFIADDFAQEKTSIEISDEAFAVPVFLDRIRIVPAKARYGKAIERAKKTGAKVFLLFLDAVTSARILEQGYTNGLFNEGTIVFGSLENCGPALLPFFSPDAPVAAIMRGYMCVRKDLNYAMLHSEQGRSFIQRWRAQPATMTPNGASVDCSNIADREGTKLLARDFSGVPKCAGYNFSSFDAQGSDLLPSASYVYDAVYVAAQALNALVYTQALVNVSKSALLTELKTGAYSGVTGNISFNSGMVLVDGKYVDADSVKATSTDDGSDSGGGVNDYYARGDREEGLHYKIMNFNAEAYAADQSSGGFVQVGEMSTDGMYKLCAGAETESIGDTSFVCSYNVVYNTADNSRPTERRPQVRASVSSWGEDLLIAVFVVAVVIILILWGLITLYRNHKLVKPIQPVLIHVTMLGLLLACIRSILPLFEISDDVCRTEKAVGHLAFFVFFSSIYVKLWRVNQLMHLTSFEKKKITNADAMRLTWYGIGGGIVLIAIVTAVGGASVHTILTDQHNQETLHLYCQANNVFLEIGLMVLELILLLAGVSLARALFDLPGAVNESKNILVALAVVIILCGVGYPLSKLSIVDANTGIFLCSVFFSGGALLCALILFTPRVSMVLRGYKVSASLRIQGVEEAAEEKKDLLRACRATLNAVKSEEEKAKLCVSQIELWYRYLAATGGGDQTNSVPLNDGIIADAISRKQASKIPRVGSDGPREISTALKE